MNSRLIQVLLLEDEPGYARLITELLQRAEDDSLMPAYEISSAARLHDALNLMSQQIFDVILIDLSLPDSFGLDTFREIHAHTTHGALIILSGNEDERLAVEAMQEGAQDYIAKRRVDDYFLKRSIRYALERKQAQEKMLFQTNLLSAMSSAVSSAVIATDLNGRVLYWNPAAERLYGWTPEEALDSNITELTTAPQSQKQAQEIMEKLRRGGSWNGEFIVQRRDGSTFPALVSDSPILDSKGEPMGIIGVSNDIADLKQAEEQIKRQVGRLNSLRNIDIAISSSFDMQVILDIVLQQALAQLNVDASAILLFQPQRKIIEYAASRGFQSNATQYTQLKLGEGYAGRVLLERRVVHVRDLMETDSKLAKVLKLAKENFFDYYGVPLIAKGEIKGVLEIYHRSILKTDPEWMGFLETLAGQAAIAIDNSQLFHSLQRANIELEHRVGERTRKLSQTNIELEHANRAKDEFLTAMSHELRTPLNSILGLSESLLEQRRGPLNEHQQQFIQTIETSGRHLLELINDILDLSKIEAGKFDYYPQVVDVNALCRASLAFVKEQAIRKSISIHYDDQGANFNMYGDPRRLKQILVNLLTNAVKFTAEYGQVTLQVEANTEDNQVQFLVIDTGIGISSEDLKRLFKPFVQVDSNLNRRFEGTGLGLVLVQRLADLHGGSVQVESEVGEGSRFTVTIPWQQAVVSQLEFGESGHAESARHESQESTPILKKTSKEGVVLLAEDHVANIQMISEYLESRGFKVVNAQDGIEAIEKAEVTKPDIILMDIQMPAMDGLEAIQHLRADPRFDQTPIIALTALAMSGDRERCLEAGANEYMSKPVSLKKLVVAINNLLEQDH